MIINPIKLSQDLISCKSVTPIDDGAIGILRGVLEGLGFSCYALDFTSKEDPAEVRNLYARIGGGGPNLCFAGHTDVVPPGDLRLWAHDPFDPVIRDEILYGRGASDMKTAIAAWVAAVSEFLAERESFIGSLSLLITGDEEALAFNGTRKVLEWLKERNEKIDACIVGEPTSHTRLGDMIKIGRRGSISFTLTVQGAQGHAAYPQLADNPVTRLINILHDLKEKPLDEGTEFFQKSNLEVTTIDVGNPAANVIPALATAKFNIRFNDRHSAKSLEFLVREMCGKYAGKYDLTVHVTGEAFITPPGDLSGLVAGAVKKITGLEPELSTTGGTSDARFIREICPVVECGLLNTTAHKIDECASEADIRSLAAIYKEIIAGFFRG